MTGDNVFDQNDDSPFNYDGDEPRNFGEEGAGFEEGEALGFGDEDASSADGGLGGFDDEGAGTIDASHFDQGSFDDDEFILADWDESDETEPLAAEPPAELPAEPSVEPRVADVEPAPAAAGGMFGDDSVIPENVLGESRVFSEDGGEGWGGEEVGLDELGIETDAEPEEVAGPAYLNDDDAFDIMGDDELTLIDDDVELEEVAHEVPAAPAYDASEHQPEEFEEDPADYAVAAGASLAALGHEGFEDHVEGHVDEQLVEASDAPIDYNTRDFDAIDEGSDPEWAPVVTHEGLEDEVVEGEDEAFEGEGLEGEGLEGEQPDFSEYEESYYDETETGFVPVAAVKSSPMRWVVGIAAVLTLSAAGALWYVKEFKGKSGEEVEVIEVIKVDRPSPQVTLQAPTRNETGTKDPVTKDPVTKDPVTKDPVTKDPVTKDPVTKDPVTKDPVTKDPVTKDPVTKDPVTKDPVTKDPVTKDPVTKDPVTKDPVTKDPVTKDPVTKDPITKDPVTKDPVTKDPVATPVQVGSDGTSMTVRDDDIMETHRRKVVQDFKGLVMGTQALAQLHNDNIFIGKVKALNASYVTLKTTQGEISLQRREIRTLTSLAAAEYEEWSKMVASGFIKLHNNNRLRGRIVEARDDAIVLMVNSNKVIIPKSAIESVMNDSRKGVQLNSGEVIENDDWFRELVEKKIRDRDASIIRRGRRPQAAPGK